MKGKILLVVGLGVGYILGSRAGRERYEQIKAAANKIWNDPHVQKQVNNAEDFIKDKAPDVAEFLADGAKKIVAQVAGRPTKSTAKQTVAASASSAAADKADAEATTAAKTAAKKPAARKPATKKPASSAASKPAASK